MPDRPRGWAPTTPEDVEAVWADARRVVRSELPVMRRRQLRRSIPEVTRRIGIESTKGTAMKFPPFVADLGERALKTFAYATLGALPATAATTEFTGVPWLAAVSVGLSATVLSVLGSLASFKIGRSGTASLTKAVEPVE